MLQDFLQTTVGLNISALYIDVNKCRSISEEIISRSLLFKHGGSKIFTLASKMNNISDEKMCEPILYMRRRPKHSDLEQTEHGRQWEPGQQHICRIPFIQTGPLKV